MTAFPTSTPTFRWRARSYLLFGAGVTMLAGGVYLARPALLYLGLAVLLAPVAAALFGPSRAPTATMDWHLEGAGPDVRAVGTIAFAPPTDARDVDIEFTSPAGLEETAPPLATRGKDRVSFELRWNAPAPVVVPVPAPELSWQDPAGLVERNVEWSPTDLVVERYPAELIHIGSVRLERTIAVPGETLSRRVGPDGEFFGIRYAAPAEPPRRVNWPATARTGHLMVNEFQVERTGDILLLLDARPSPLGARLDAQLLSLSVAAAHGIAESFLREKARVGLAVYGEFLDTVPLASGRTQRLRIRTALQKVRVTLSPGPTERCAVSLRRYFPPGVTTIVFSSLADEESRYLILHLRRRGFPVVVLSPSPLPIVTAHPTLSVEEEELISRIAHLIRRDRIARTWEDAPVVDWDEHWSLGGLVDLLKRPGRRGRSA
ncbi:MAG TPA: DUF58 domain-containing protein [Thermoplasmata archaeon]|nr:DUF58 domain-containing protein [Thermoplasmata archaeon]